MPLTHAFPTVQSSTLVEKSGHDLGLNSIFRTKSEILNRVEELSDERKPLQLLYIEIENFSAFRFLYGDQMTMEILESAERDLMQVSETVLPPWGQKQVELLEAGQFMILWGPFAESDADAAELELPQMAMNLRLHFRTLLRKTAGQMTGQDFDVLAGYSLLTRYGSQSPEACLYNALCDAQRAARGHLSREKLGVIKEFREILEGPGITTVYQPIVNLSSGEILAWEALTRGPEQSMFSSPNILFDYAEDIGEIFALEKVCRENAIRCFGNGVSGKKLFLNIHPKTLADPLFSPESTTAFLAMHGLAPEQIVFEITERHAIRDFTLFHDTLSLYRQCGYQVAVDDVGSGYSGLWSIAEIRPDFIKIDMFFIRGIDTHPVKRALVETVVAFAERLGCKIIAEGIETATELSSLMSMGAHYGQGYHLARPSFPKPGLSLKRPSWASGPKPNLTEIKCFIPVRELTDAAYAIGPTSKVKEVKAILQGDEPLSAVAVIRDEKPIGLILSHHLDRVLSSQYGMALYYHREVTRIMDPAPMIADAATPVESVARQAMNRERSKIYDHILVTEQGIFKGIVSVQKMLDTLAAVQVEMAKGANPLTGLPGNLGIEREIESRTAVGETFSIIYADLDNFKVYNDVYGFKEGDAIILLLAKILNWALRRHGSKTDFAGHLGGDDFVILTTPEKGRRIGQGIIRCFGRLSKRYYNAEDQRRGDIIGKGRSGHQKKFPLVSVSLAQVDCQGKCSLAAIAKRSAEMKKCAKKVQGNSYVRDRRGPLTPENCPGV